MSCFRSRRLVHPTFITVAKFAAQSSGGDVQDHNASRNLCKDQIVMNLFDLVPQKCETLIRISKGLPLKTVTVVFVDVKCPIRLE